METIGGFKALIARRQEERRNWEEMRATSPHTTCEVYPKDCETTLRLGANIEYRGLSCSCIERAKRALEKADIDKAVRRAVAMWGGLPSELAREMTFETYLDNPDWRPDESEIAYRAWLRCKDYAAEPTQTPFLTLFGGYGGGKTHLAMSIAQKAGMQVVWANCTELFSYLKSRFKLDFDSEFERIKLAEMLVLDDLGANSFTPWIDEKLYEIVNHRHQERMPTVITTNYNPYGENPIDARLLSRITDLRRGDLFHLDIQDNRQMLPRREYRGWPGDE